MRQLTFWQTEKNLYTQCEIVCDTWKSVHEEREWDTGRRPIQKKLCAKSELKIQNAKYGLLTQLNSKKPFKCLNTNIETSNCSHYSPCMAHFETRIITGPAEGKQQQQNRTQEWHVKSRSLFIYSHFVCGWLANMFSKSIDRCTTRYEKKTTFKWEWIVFPSQILHARTRVRARNIAFSRRLYAHLMCSTFESTAQSRNFDIIFAWGGFFRFLSIHPSDGILFCGLKKQVQYEKREKAKTRAERDKWPNV